MRPTADLPKLALVVWFSLIAAAAGALHSPRHAAAQATHFAIEAPEIPIVGAAFDIVVTALDAGENVDAAYAGVVAFTSTDPLAVLPADSTLIAGVRVFTVTLRTAGFQTITVTDTATAITGSTGVDADEAVATPTLGTWAMILLATLLGAGALLRLRPARSRTPRD